MAAHSKAATPTALEKTAVALAEVRLKNGSVEYWAAGSGESLSGIQRNYLESLGFRVISGKAGFHAEEQIGYLLPEGSDVLRWGISWTTPQKGIPCIRCNPLLDTIGGVIEK
jgi:hypothetical protein